MAGKRQTVSQHLEKMRKKINHAVKMNDQLRKIAQAAFEDGRIARQTSSDPKPREDLTANQKRELKKDLAKFAEISAKTLNADISAFKALAEFERQAQAAGKEPESISFLDLVSPEATPKKKDLS